MQKNNNQRTWVQEEVWQRIQDKSLSNGCKDFKWLLIHKKLLVRSIMHAHRYQGTKNCLRIKCQREETIEHIMRECFFCKGGVGGNAEAARLYKKNFVFYDGGEGYQTERKDPYSSIIGEIIFVEGPSTIHLGVI